VNSFRSSGVSFYQQPRPQTHSKNRNSIRANVTYSDGITNLTSTGFTKSSKAHNKTMTGTNSMNKTCASSSMQNYMEQRRKKREPKPLPEPGEPQPLLKKIENRSLSNRHQDARRTPLTAASKNKQSHPPEAFKRDTEDLPRVK